MFEKNRKPTIEEEMEKLNLLNMEIEKQELEVINNIENTNIITKLFEDKKIRYIIDNVTNEPWFVLADVLNAMSTGTDVYYAKKSIIQRLGDETVSERVISDTLGRQQSVVVVKKPAITFLVDRSNTEMGIKLTRFIHLELLPEIEKTGNYVSNNSILAELLNEIKLLKEENQEIKSLISNFLTHDTGIDTNRTFFNLQEVCDFLNKKYKITNGIIPNPTILKEFLKHIKVLKSNYTPYVSYINKNYIDSNLNLSVFGINHMLKEAGKYMIEL